MKKRLLLIINPKSGKGIAKQCVFELIEIFTTGGFEVCVYPTKDKQSTVRTVKKEAGRFSLIVCCGGDGTLNEVINGIMAGGHDTPVGYIPMGTTNDFAKTLGLPCEPAEAARAIIGGRKVRYDIGEFGRKYFSYIAAAGAFTEASYSAPQAQKNALGHFAYVLEGVKSFTKIKPFLLKAEFEGGAISGKYIYASISNTTSLGGIVRLDKKEVDTSDGYFEFLLVKNPKNAAEAVKLVADILNRRFNNNNISLLHVQKVRMSFESPVAFTLDGENGGTHKKIDISNRHGALTLIVPQK